MYKLILLVLLSLSQSQYVSADDLERRRANIISVIDEELEEVQRLNSRSSDPDLLLRMAELNLEKARLFREQENDEYVNSSVAERRKKGKNSYFQRSARYFSKANSIAVGIARRFKSYKRLGEVYYILGFNAKEANKPREAAKYLGLATRKTNDKKTKVRTQISLAEVYYNEKNCKKAIPLYESALDKVNDKWWTKDAFNLGWCYYRQNKYSKAINIMQSVYKRSGSSKFIDMRSQVERDIGLFYATSNRIKEGVSFYKKIGINFSKQLLSIAISLNSQGKFTLAEKVLNQAEKYETAEDQLTTIYIEKLILYEKFGKHKAHLLTAKKLFQLYRKNKVTGAQLKQYEFQLEKLAAILQRQAVGKTYRRQKKARRRKAEQAIDYFGILAVVNKSKSAEYRYLQAETAFAIGQYSRAYDYYKDTYEYTKANEKASPFKIKALDGMIAVLSAYKKAPVDFNIYVFEQYLEIYPKGKKSKEAYKRLYSNYLAKKDYKNAKLVLDRFVKYYPKDPAQEGLIAELMEISRKNKDYITIRNWISAIEAGRYFVSPKYKIKLQELLTSIQIDGVQGELAQGNKKTALVGYLEILDDPYATKKSKVNAKYNLAALYFELGDTENTHRWALSALKEMETSDVYKFSSSFVTMSNFLFSSLEFKKSSEVSEMLLVKLCKKKTKKKNVAFKNASFISLADGDINSAEKLVVKAKSCRVPKAYISEVEYEIMREYFIKRNWNRYEYYVMKLKDSVGVYNKVIDDLLNLITIHLRFNNQQKVSQINKSLWQLFYKAKKKNDPISMRGLDYFATLKLKKMESTANQINLIKFRFPEQKFAVLQKQKLELLTKLTEQANDVQAIGSGVGIVNSFKLLFEIYNKVAKEIFEFVPEGKSPEYIKQFKQDFNQVGRQLSGAAQQYKAEAARAISSNAILNKNNFYFQDNKLPVEFHGEGEAVLMDRGGKQ